MIEWGTVHTKFGAQMLVKEEGLGTRGGYVVYSEGTSLSVNAVSIENLPDNYILDSFKNIGILVGSNPSSVASSIDQLKKLEINRVQDQLVGKNKADLPDFMGKGIIWGDADGFKWALVSLDRILVATEWEGKYPRASIIAKLDDLDKRAEVVLGIKERRKNRIFQMTDGARMKSPFKAYDKVKFFKGAMEVHTAVWYQKVRDVAIIIETKNSTKGGPRVNKVFINFGWGMVQMTNIQQN
ncbi:hypothetical protein ACJX0J_027034, partial [Zea mays]